MLRPPVSVFGYVIVAPGVKVKLAVSRGDAVCVGNGSCVCVFACVDDAVGVIAIVFVVVGDATREPDFVTFSVFVGKKLREAVFKADAVDDRVGATEIVIVLLARIAIGATPLTGK